MIQLENLDWTEVLQIISKLATSELAREQLIELSPVESVEQAKKINVEIQNMIQILKIGKRPSFDSLDFCQLWLDRLKKGGVLKPIELKDVLSFCEQIESLKDCLNEINSSWSDKLSGEIMDATRPLSAITQVITEEGGIRTDASENLYSLTQEKISLEKNIRKTLDRLVKTHEMENILQDRYVTNREGRWVLPVKGGMQHQLEGIIHDSSQSKQTVFMEPQEVVSTNNKLRQVEMDINDEIQTILQELSSYLAKHESEFEKSKSKALECDIRLSEASFALKTDSVSCEFDESELRLKGLRHPLLVFNNDVDIIPNNVELSKERSVLLLSGPNAGGKTVLLKSIGLSAQMARCGLLICAEKGSKLPFFNTIHTCIGDAQSVESHLSTFAAHLLMLSKGLELKGSTNLILVDEICGSTDPEEGAALARSFIESYGKNGVFSIITSHLGPLKRGWGEDSHVVNGSMEYDEDKGAPTYSLVMGLYGRSLAFQTAKSVGVPGHIRELALSYMNPEIQKQTKAMEEVEKFRKELTQIKKEAEIEKDKAKRLREKYSDHIERFKAEREKLLKKSVEKAQDQIEDHLKKVRAEGFKAAQRMKAEFPKIIKKAEPKQLNSPEDFQQSFPPGSKIHIKSLNQDGIVQGTPNTKGEVPVLSNSIRMNLHWKELTPPVQPTSHQSTPSRNVSYTGYGGSDLTIDVRGFKVEDALKELESRLDQATRDDISRAKVIHGHGTEALKRAVRSYLSRSIYVQKWKIGDDDTGGDGVTWVEL